MSRRGETLQLSTYVDDEEQDIYQLGGHVLLDSHGSVVYAYKCASFDDWPSIDDLLHEISRAEVDDRTKRLRSRTVGDEADGRPRRLRRRCSTNAVAAAEWLSTVGSSKKSPKKCTIS